MKQTLFKFFTWLLWGVFDIIPLIKTNNISGKHVFIWRNFQIHYCLCICVSVQCPMLKTDVYVPECSRTLLVVSKHRRPTSMFLDQANREKLRWPYKKDELNRKTNLNGKGPSIEEPLWWRTNFAGGRPSIEDDPWWKMTFNGWWLSIKYDYT